MSHFGIDIGSYAIKFIKADGHGDGAKIAKIGSVYNPVGQILPEDPHLFETLAQAIREGARQLGLAGLPSHISLPGPHAYISIASMPTLSDAELSSAIKWEAEQHIPIPLSEVNFQYSVIYRPAKNSTEDTMSVLMVGAPKQTVNRYVELMETAGIEVIGLEPEILSMNRAFIPEKDEQSQSVTTLLCNFGALTSSFVVVDRGMMQVAHSAAVGSLALTRALERGLSLDPAQSEEYKRAYGLDQTKLEGRVVGILSPVFDALVQELRKTIQFYVSKSPATNRINRIILSGGGSNLPAMAGFLVERLGVEVSLGNPFSRFQLQHKVTQPTDVASYAVAVGAAVKGF